MINQSMAQVGAWRSTETYRTIQSGKDEPNIELVPASVCAIS